MNEKSKINIDDLVLSVRESLNKRRPELEEKCRMKCQEVLDLGGLDLNDTCFNHIKPHPLDVFSNSVKRAVDDIINSHPFIDFGKTNNWDGLSRFCQHYGVDFVGEFYIRQEPSDGVNYLARWRDNDFLSPEPEFPSGENYGPKSVQLCNVLRKAILDSEIKN